MTQALAESRIAARKKALETARLEVNRLGASDKRRVYHQEDITLSEVRVYGTRASQGPSPADGVPLLVEQMQATPSADSARNLWINGTTQAIGSAATQMNSPFLLEALIRQGEKTWPAIVYRVKADAEKGKPEDFKALMKRLSKQEALEDAEEEEEFYEVPVEDRQRVTAELLAWLTAILAGLKLVVGDESSAAVAEGARYAGGGLSADELAGIASRIAQEQGTYIAGFGEDFRGRIETVIAGRYPSREAFEEAVQRGIVEAAEARGDLYSVGAGQPAWRAGVSAAARKSGIAGAVWVCTFAPTTCTDCISLHGRWFTWDELESMWGETQCNGSCLCGMVPADNPEDMAIEELDGLEEEGQAPLDI